MTTLVNSPRHRRSIRAQSFDYASPGAYFVTICAHHRLCVFGELFANKMRLSPAGQIIQRTWIRLPEFFEKIALDIFVVMPNHFHGILWITEQENQSQILASKGISPQTNTNPLNENSEWYGTQSGSLSAIIQNFKSVSTRKIHQFKFLHDEPVWQRNYWERIIRNERELNAVREYIANNPAKWTFDQENPDIRS